MKKYDVIRWEKLLGNRLRRYQCTIIILVVLYTKQDAYQPDTMSPKADHLNRSTSDIYLPYWNWNSSTGTHEYAQNLQ